MKLSQDLLTTREVSKILKIGMTAGYGLIRSGELNYIRIGRSYKVPKKCLEEFIENRLNTYDLIIEE